MTPAANTTAAAAKKTTFGAFGESAGRTRVGIAQMTAERALRTAPSGRRASDVTGLLLPSGMPTA
jgi:hypothetical protein